MLPTPTRESRAVDGLFIDGLRFSYGREFSLHVGSLRLAAGEQVLLAGPSGSGKSTLLHLVAGLDEPEAGSITIGGRDIIAVHGARRDRLRGQQIGMIFQTFNLLHGFTAVENVMMPLMMLGVAQDAMRQRAQDALRRLGIERPHADVDTLSVGQQQRVAVARATVTGPALVLADEPTASLDPEASAAAIAVIREACVTAGASLLVTSHDPALRCEFERVIDVREFVTVGVQA